ncbi:hypothetical protein MBLNU457_4046t2 [Dothideomycetes sp. NU457]
MSAPESVDSLGSLSAASSEPVKTPKTANLLPRYHIYTREVGAVDGQKLVACIEKIFAEEGVDYTKLKGLPWAPDRAPFLSYHKCDSKFGPASIQICLEETDMKKVLHRVQDEARDYYEIMEKCAEKPVHGFPHRIGCGRLK